MNIQEQAEKTLQILRANGWTTGTLYVQPVGVDRTKCKMCVLGAAATAYFGDPEFGYDTEDDGYAEFISALADELKPDWRTTSYDDDPDTCIYEDPNEVVYSANDDRFADPENGTHVFAALERLAGGK